MSYIYSTRTRPARDPRCHRNAPNVSVHAFPHPLTQRRPALHNSPETSTSSSSFLVNRRLHALISAPSTSSRSLTNITWDMRLPPSRSARLPHSHRYGIPPQILSEHATSPPMSRMHISIDLSGSIWRADVVNRLGVTINDVLEQIYTSLRKHIRGSAEWNNMSESQRAYVARAFYRRLEVSADPKYEKSAGVRKIDLLQSRSVFVGLKPDPLYSDSWVIATARHA